MKTLNDFIVALDVLLPLLVSNVLSSSGECVDDFSVVEGEGDHSDLDGHLISFVAIDTERWELGQSTLHFVFNVLSELTNFRNRVSFIQILIDECLIHIIRYTEFTRVISCRNSFNVILDVV